VRWKAPDGGLLLIYRPRRGERLSWPGWLTYSGWLTHISGYPSASGRAKDSEVRRRKDRRYRPTVIPRKLVSWSLTSLFSTNMAISETKLFHATNLGCGAACCVVFAPTCRSRPIHMTSCRIHEHLRAARQRMVPHGTATHSIRCERLNEPLGDVNASTCRQDV